MERAAHEPGRSHSLNAGPALARRLPRRDRLAIVSGLFGTTLLAWGYLVKMANEMGAGSMDMSAMAVRAWSVADFGWMLAMWTVMMIGMMLPSAAPTTLVYAAVARKAAREGAVVAPTAVFVSGYLAMWTLFSVGATALQWALDRATLLSPAMVATSPAIGACLLGAAGLYQLTPAKSACLRHCRSPAEFIAGQLRPGSLGALRMGAAHGGYCLGCCWALMGLLFLGGVMNLLWVAAITGFVLVEKLLPGGLLTARLSGAAMLALGAGLALRALGG